MLYDELLTQFRRDFWEIKSDADNFKSEIRNCYRLCNDTLNRMRGIVVEEGFKSEQEEIHFFKEIKVVPMSFLMYYAEVSSYMANRPKNHERDGLKYLKRQMARVDDFLTKHVEFLIYMESKETHLDPYYFTREYLRNNMNMHRYPYLKDEQFDTDKDYILAKIRGWGMYVDYLKKERAILEQLANGHQNTSANPLRYTGRPIDKAELYYALLAAGVFNHGNARIIDIVQGLGEVMGDDEQEVYRRLAELKKRKDRTMFLKRLIVNLERYLDNDDAFV